LAKFHSFPLQGPCYSDSNNWNQWSCGTTLDVRIRIAGMADHCYNINQALKRNAGSNQALDGKPEDQLYETDRKGCDLPHWTRKAVAGCGLRQHDRRWKGRDLFPSRL